VYPRFSEFGAGDIAFCQATCNCDADCLNPVDRCFAWLTPAFEQRFGTRGLCDYGPDATDSLADCATAQDGVGGAGGALHGASGGATEP
jgi:hypothetical protein